MPRLGAHVSTAGGVSLALERAGRIHLQSVQIFAKNNKCWIEKPIDPDEVRRFRALAAAFDRRDMVSHAGYLINLAASDEDIYKRSTASLRDELARADSLGLAWVVLHPGSHGGRGEEWGLDRVVAALRRVLHETRGMRVGILVETTAGQGNSLGWKFEHLKRILAGLKYSRRVGVCVDTCHIFAAGYDIRTREGYESTMTALHRLVGLPTIRAFHLNDSVKGLGSRVDRHEHIGKGQIGLSAFRFLMNDPRFSDLPMILETPKGPDMKEDIINLNQLRKLIHRKSPGRHGRLTPV